MISPSRVASYPGQSIEQVDPADILHSQTIEKGHGRIETRIIAVRTKLPSGLNHRWPGLKQIIRIERRRELKTLCQRQVTYAITSLPSATHGPARLLALARDHWQIENCLFHVRDVTFAEDDCRVRSGNAPLSLAHLRDAALTVIRRGKLKPRPARETFAANPKAAIRAILKL